MDWLLTVPLLLVEIVLCCKLSEEETFDRATKLGVASALMIIIGYPGELLTEQSEISGRWAYWAAAMVPFLYVVYSLLVGLKAATESEEDDKIKSLLYAAQYATVISWLTYPVVYILPMFGLEGATLVVAIQVGLQVVVCAFLYLGAICSLLISVSVSVSVSVSLFLFPLPSSLFPLPSSLFSLLSPLHSSLYSLYTLPSSLPSSLPPFLPSSPPSTLPLPPLLPSLHSSPPPPGRVLCL